MQRERRSQVEPRCAERWHLRDDEQFDLAAWFLSPIWRLHHFDGAVVSYFNIAFPIEFLFVCTSGCRNEVHKFYNLATNLHLVVGMDNKLRLSIGIDKALSIVVKVHLEAVLGEVY